MGIQDATRKQSTPSQSPGAWAGLIVRIKNSELGILISKKRWRKTRVIVRKLLNTWRKDSFDTCIQKENDIPGYGWDFERKPVGGSNDWQGHVDSCSYQSYGLGEIKTFSALAVCMAEGEKLASTKT